MQIDVLHAVIDLLPETVSDAFFQNCHAYFARSASVRPPSIGCSSSHDLGPAELLGMITMCHFISCECMSSVQSYTSAVPTAYLQ